MLNYHNNVPVIPVSRVLWTVLWHKARRFVPAKNWGLRKFQNLSGRKQHEDENIRGKYNVHNKGM